MKAKGLWGFYFCDKLSILIELQSLWRTFLCYLTEAPCQPHEVWTCVHILHIRKWIVLEILLAWRNSLLFFNWTLGSCWRFSLAPDSESTNIYEALRRCQALDRVSFLGFLFLSWRALQQEGKLSDCLSDTGSGHSAGSEPGTSLPFTKTVWRAVLHIGFSALSSFWCHHVLNNM
jgi:hypothetical protein